MHEDRCRAQMLHGAGVFTYKINRKYTNIYRRIWFYIPHCFLVRLLKRFYLWRMYNATNFKCRNGIGFSDVFGLPRKRRVFCVRVAWLYKHFEVMTFIILMVIQPTKVEIEFHEIRILGCPTVDGRNPTPVDRWFIPLFFIGVQPSFWWCRISSMHTILSRTLRYPRNGKRYVKNLEVTGLKIFVHPNTVKYEQYSWNVLKCYINSLINE